jgi:uncharacterized membrane protein
MTFLELLLLSLLSIIYLTCVFTVALITFRNGRWFMGILGLFFPVFWLIGAVLPPRSSA